MQCLKCGRETHDSHVFCDECLETMSQHPVKPGTPVSIHKRDPKPAKVPGKKQIKPDELLAKLQKENRRLTVWVIILSVLLVIIASGLAWKVYQDLDRLPLGQNYNTETQMTLDSAPPTQITCHEN